MNSPFTSLRNAGHRKDRYRQEYSICFCLSVPPFTSIDDRSFSQVRVASRRMFSNDLSPISSRRFCFAFSTLTNDRAILISTGALLPLARCTIANPDRCPSSFFFQPFDSCIHNSIKIDLLPPPAGNPEQRCCPAARFANPIFCYSLSPDRKEFACPYCSEIHTDEIRTAALKSAEHPPYNLPDKPDKTREQRFLFL